MGPRRCYLSVESEFANFMGQEITLYHQVQLDFRFLTTRRILTNIRTVGI
jgi:hypothetical protein